MACLNSGAAQRHSDDGGTRKCCSGWLCLKRECFRCPLTPPDGVGDRLGSISDGRLLLIATAECPASFDAIWERCPAWSIDSAEGLSALYYLAKYCWEMLLERRGPLQLINIIMVHPPRLVGYCCVFTAGCWYPRRSPADLARTLPAAWLSETAGRVRS